MFLPHNAKGKGKSTKLRGLNLIPRPLLGRSRRYRGCLARPHSCHISRAAGFCVKFGKHQGSKTSGVKHLVSDIADCGLPSGDRFILFNVTATDYSQAHR